MSQPITTNPVLIALINMTVVFCVLYGLSLVVRLIKVIDPTQKKKITKERSEVLEKTVPTVAAASQPQEDYDEMMILFTAAIAAYGYKNAKVVAIRPVSSNTWSQAARMETVNSRNQMF
jgi:Na+-transporting methylmalonyl-CoA/oxaloacetate decarboxylase gamma subunit